jgi:hypothetical protein
VLERTTRIVAENFARAINRRSFLRKTGEAAFASFAALAVGQFRTAFAAAGVGPQPPVYTRPLVPQCAPPGPYCNLNSINEPNGCHGSNCFQHLYNGTVYQCRVYYQFYAAGCWTTAVTGGYWVCCDCECGVPRVTTCGCAQFSGSPQPRPDGNA